MAIYKFKFLGSITRCRSETDERHNTSYVEEGEPEPVILEIKVNALSKERAERKLRRMIAWNVEQKLSNQSDG